MLILWDEPKRKLNLENRGMDFADLDMEFFAEATIVGTRQGRYKAIGLHRGIALAVIFRPLGSEAISIISMRRASMRERSGR